jgi:hypothetical protein
MCECIYAMNFLLRGVITDRRRASHLYCVNFDGGKWQHLGYISLRLFTKIKDILLTNCRYSETFCNHHAYHMRIFYILFNTKSTYLQYARAFCSMFKG